MQQPQTPYSQQPLQHPLQPQELFIAKYANGGTASVTPYELVLTRGRNQTVIPISWCWKPSRLVKHSSTM